MGAQLRAPSALSTASLATTPRNIATVEAAKVALEEGDLQGAAEAFAAVLQDQQNPRHSRASPGAT